MGLLVNPPDEAGRERGSLPEDYEPPRIVALGTLAELTAGGDPNLPDDGFGGAGGTGSI
jgi:hypothetical protein